MNEDREDVYVTAVGEPDPVDIQTFWARSQRATGTAPSASMPPAWCFGDTVEMADKLIDLVVRGTKRATASATAEYEAEGESVPAVGDLSIATDDEVLP